MVSNLVSNHVFQPPFSDVRADIFPNAFCEFLFLKNEFEIISSGLYLSYDEKYLGLLKYPFNWRYCLE